MRRSLVVAADLMWCGKRQSKSLHWTRQLSAVLWLPRRAYKMGSGILKINMEIGCCGNGKILFTPANLSVLWMHDYFEIIVFLCWVSWCFNSVSSCFAWLAIYVSPPWKSQSQCRLKSDNLCSICILSLQNIASYEAVIGTVGVTCAAFDLVTFTSTESARLVSSTNIYNSSQIDAYHYSCLSASDWAHPISFRPPSGGGGISSFSHTGWEAFYENEKLGKNGLRVQPACEVEFVSRWARGWQCAWSTSDSPQKPRADWQQQSELRLYKFRLEFA